MIVRIEIEFYIINIIKFATFLDGSLFKNEMSKIFKLFLYFFISIK